MAFTKLWGENSTDCKSSMAVCKFYQKKSSCFGSNPQPWVTRLVLLITFLLQLSEAEPDRQVDSGMLKRVNPGHPVTLIS